MNNLPPAEVVIENVSVITMDPACPRAKGIAIAKGAIIGILEDDSIEWPLTPSGRKLDGKGMCLLPGLVDAHLHLRALMSETRNVQCGPEKARTIPDIISLLQDMAGHMQPGEWIRATGCNPFYLEEKRMPDKNELDLASLMHPIRLRHVNRHVSALNSKALEIINSKYGNKLPTGVNMEKDPISNQYTGIIYGGDAWLSRHILPSVPEAISSNVVQGLQKKIVSYGITALEDASPHNTKKDLEFWMEQARQGWPIAISLMSGPETHTELHNYAAQITLPEYIKVGALKVVMEANPNLYPTFDELVHIAFRAIQNETPLAIHVVDPEMICSSLEAIRLANESVSQPSKLLHRFEHLSLCPDGLLRDIAEAGIMAVTNPSFIYDHGDRYLFDVDEYEHEWLYKMKSVIDAGILLAAGSDAPVSSIDPWAGIRSACLRQTSSGQALNNDERLNRYQALELYTVNGAIASGWGKSRGRIKQGYQADFILTNKNPLLCPFSDLNALLIDSTWIAGKQVFSQSSKNTAPE